MGQTLCLNHAHINTLRYISAVLFFTGPLFFFWGGGEWGGLPFVLSVKLPPQGRGIFLPRRHHDGAKGNSGVSARTAGDVYRNKTSFNHRSSLIRITPVNPTPARNLVCVLRHTQKTDMSGIRRPRGIEREKEKPTAWTGLRLGFRRSVSRHILECCIGFGQWKGNRAKIRSKFCLRWVKRWKSFSFPLSRPWRRKMDQWKIQKWINHNHVISFQIQITFF